MTLQFELHSGQVIVLDPQDSIRNARTKEELDLISAADAILNNQPIAYVTIYTYEQTPENDWEEPETTESVATVILFPSAVGQMALISETKEELAGVSRKAQGNS